MPATRHNIVIEQGAVFFDGFGWRADSQTEPGTPGEPISLEGAQLRMQVRRKQGEPVLLEATIGDGLAHDGAGGNVIIELSAIKTNALSVKSCRYDLEVVFSEDDVHRLVEGGVTVTPNITQDPGEPVVTS